MTPIDRSRPLIVRAACAVARGYLCLALFLLIPVSAGTGNWMLAAVLALPILVAVWRDSRPSLVD